MSAQPKPAGFDLAHVREVLALHLRALEGVAREFGSDDAIRARYRSKRLEAAYQSVVSARVDLQLALRDLDHVIGRKP